MWLLSTRVVSIRSAVCKRKGAQEALAYKWQDSVLHAGGFILGIAQGKLMYVV